MFIHCSLLSVTLMISVLAHAGGLTNSSYNLLPDQATKSCPSDGTPVCGLRDKQLVLFSNGCLFNAANKNIWPGETIFRKVPLQNCIQGCKFSCTKTYKPVCTRNKRTYRKHLFRNQCELTKQICNSNEDYLKINVYECLPKEQPNKLNKSLEKRSESTKKKGRKPVPCTNVFRPVCGSYLGVKSSFKNECLLNSENVAFNRDWRIVKIGMCPEDLIKKRRRKHKPDHLHSIRKRSFRNDIFSKLPPRYNNVNVNNINELNTSPNDVHVYVPTAFQDEFLNHVTTSYHHQTKDPYDEYLTKIEKFSSFDVSFAQVKETDGPNSAKAIINSLPFALNRVNINYLANKDLASEVNQQTILPVSETIVDERPKQIYYALKASKQTGIDNAKMNEGPKTSYVIAETTERPAITSTMQLEVMTKPVRKEESSDPKIECKFGSDAICAILTDGSARTFETICDMMAANVYFKKTWNKLHDGPCENCKYNCSKEYKPVCVSKNGVNYTMINECYYNMGICLDKKSKWQLLSNKECDRYTRIPDKYIYSKPGFSYTSSIFTSQTTELPNTNTLLQTIAGKPSKLRSRKNKKRKGNNKREISSLQNSVGCCLISQFSNRFSDEGLKCKCWGDIEHEPHSRPVSHETQTESYIMRLVKASGKSIGII